MPGAYLEEARRRAISLVVDEGIGATRVANGLGTWESGVGSRESGMRRWVDHHLVEAGRKPVVCADERDELVRLRRERRVLRMERDLLSRAAACFAGGSSCLK